MQEIVDKIKETFSTFVTENGKEQNGNKAAGTRARKASLELEKLLKEYRKISLGK